MNSSSHALLDFGVDARGEGRKLERFGPWLVDRPAPAATGAAKLAPDRWREADARFELTGDRAPGLRGKWTPEDFLGRAWEVEWPVGARKLKFELRATEFGHVGLFAEQADNWGWIAEQVARLATGAAVLNLFAYTGGSTLAAAVAGAAVTHVDAAAGVVAWARRNAALSGLDEKPIRWIVEDATKIAGRELRRGRRYHGVVLDPPSYGHGPKGEAWSLAADLPKLLSLCSQLLHPGGFLLCTCHTHGVELGDLRQLVTESFPPADAARLAGGALALSTPDGRLLPSGIAVRLAAGAP